MSGAGMGAGKLGDGTPSDGLVLGAGKVGIGGRNPGSPPGTSPGGGPLNVCATAKDADDIHSGSATTTQAAWRAEQAPKNIVAPIARSIRGLERLSTRCRQTPRTSLRYSILEKFVCQENYSQYLVGA